MKAIHINKTIFVVLKDEQVLLAIDVIKRKVGDLNKPGVGILFTIPVNYVEGIAE
jgi:nitrogen regulatory protein PII